MSDELYEKYLRKTWSSGFGHEGYGNCNSLGAGYLELVNKALNGAATLLPIRKLEQL